MGCKDKTTRYFERIASDYAPSDDIFSEDDPRVGRCKRALASLPAEDQKLFILYVEIGSVRKLSRKLRVSHSTLQYRINKIRRLLRQRAKKPQTNNQ